MTLAVTDRSPTITTSEYSYAADTTTGVPTSQTDDCILEMQLYTGNMVAGDQFRFRLYEKAISGGTQGRVREWVLTGAQPEVTFVIECGFLAHGWDFTGVKLAGTDRAINGSLRKVT